MTDNENKKRDIDALTGIETTGHEWDGLKELNNPAPRWWLWVFYACVIWSVGYWIVYPAWPTLSGSTKGVTGWTQHKKLEAEQAEIKNIQAGYLEKFQNASFVQIMNDPELYNFAVAGGGAVFKDNCATCHGTGGSGGKGYPNLNDDDWLWGGKVEDIHRTLMYGIRSGHDEAHMSQMPAFGRDGLLKREEIELLTDYVLNLRDEPDAAGHPAKGLFKTNCASCHGIDGKGNRDFGAPNLADAIWLYGGDKDSVFKTIFYARNGVMPYWQGRLSDTTIRQLAVYIHSLGGGEEAAPVNQSEAGKNAAESGDGTGQRSAE